MDLCSTIEADSESAEVMEPSECAFRDPSKNAQTAPVFLIAASQMRVNTTVAKLLSVRFRIVGSIGIDFLRPAFGMAKLPSDLRNSIYQRKQLSHIMPVCSRQRVTQRDPVGVRQEMVFAAGFPAIRRVGAGFFTSTHSSHRRAIDGGTRPVDQVGCSKTVEQFVVQSVSDTCFRPFQHSAPTRHSTTTTHFLRPHFPRNVTV